MSGPQQYDISPKQREILEWKAARRAKLRQEYLKQNYNPHRTEPMFDEAIYRLMAADATSSQYWKPTFKNWCSSIGTILLSTYTLWYCVTRYRSHKEHQYRTGQIAYADRDFKFT